jgi:capsular polysaccharide biosynthesis protein
MSSHTEPAQLSDLFGALRRHWGVVVAAALIGLAIGAVAGLVVPGRYSATASVAVNPMTTDPLNTSADSSRAVNMATERELAECRAVAAAAAKRLGARYDLSASAVQDATTAETVQDSQVLSIRFTGSSGRESADGSNAVAQAFLDARHEAAAEQVERLEAKAQKQVDTLSALAQKSAKGADESTNGPGLAERAWHIQVDTLGAKLAELASLDLDPGRIVSPATSPSQRSTPGVMSLGAGGLVLGLFVGIPLALTRRVEDSQIGGVEGLVVTEGEMVLDGTKDTDRAETWDIASFMLKIPQHMDADGTFTIMVDSEPADGRLAPGQELVDALSRRGRPSRFVDAGAINEGKISRGWPTDRKRKSWAGEVVVIDTTNVASDARKVALATRSDSVLLARSVTDDARALRRLVGLFHSKGVDIALTVLFPPRPEYIVLGE